LNRFSFFSVFKVLHDFGSIYVSCFNSQKRTQTQATKRASKTEAAGGRMQSAAALFAECFFVLSVVVTTAGGGGCGDVQAACSKAATRSTCRTCQKTNPS